VEENRIPQEVLCMNLEKTKSLRGRPRNRRQDEVRMEDWLVENGGRKGYITERNGRSSLRMARNRRILQLLME